MPDNRKNLNLDDSYDKIYRYCYFKTGHRQRAEDITQQAFLTLFAYEKKEMVKNPLAFLYTVAGNLCIDEFRRVKKEIPKEQEDFVWEENLMEEDQEEQTVLSMDVKAALKKLTAEEQELLLLRYVNELSVLEIGRMFHLSRFTVRRRLLKAVSNLRKELSDEKGNEAGSKNSL